MNYIVDELVFHHDISFTPSINIYSQFNVRIYRRVCIIGITSYAIYIAIHKGGNTVIHNIPYIHESMYDFIRNITTMNELTNVEEIFSKIKQQIIDKLNEDPTYQHLSQLNILDEIHQLKQENEKNKQKYKTKLSEMKSSIQQLQEDMKILFAKTAELQEENKLLKQEKERLTLSKLIKWNNHG
jgi:hypothetical protein